jgi:hypothetical protein
MGRDTLNCIVENGKGYGSADDLRRGTLDLGFVGTPIPMEVEVLRILNGEDVEGWTWGAAMSICCENLKGMGFAKGCYDITDKGREYLKNNP